MSQPVVAFIGAGNMARSLIGGLAAGGGSAVVRAADPDPDQLQRLAAQYHVAAAGSNREAAEGAGAVVLAVKPNVVREVALELAETLHANNALVISIAAGVRETDISRWLGYEAAVVRCMPNTPALVGAGISALYANRHVGDGQRAQAETLLRAVGSVLWVDDESLLDAVTAVSGSGPAYFFAVMEAVEAAGVELGLTPAAARQLTVETALGAARMALEADAAPAQLRANVTSRGGTTQAALEVLAQAGLAGIFARALTAARDRAREMGNELGAQ